MVHDITRYSGGYKRKWVTLACSSALALALPATAWAQEGVSAEPAPSASGNENAQNFSPDYFDRFAPNTALDMVQRVPGFAVQSAENRRGLGQGGANVLLNGERYSAKSTDIFTALRRIGASQVTRIELLDAASLDIPGLSGQVVNVVYESGGGSGQFRWTPSFRTRQTDAVLLNGEISYSGTLGGVDYTLSLNNESFRNGNEGPEVVYDGNGNITDVRDEVLFVDGDRPKISGTFRREAQNGNIANANLAYERYWNEVREDSQGQVRIRDYFEQEKEYNYEVGGDYEFGLAGGKLKLIGLHRFEHSPFFFRVLTDFTDGRDSQGTRQRLFIDETESIARAEYRWKGGSNDWQVSLEGALNTLGTGTTLETLDANGEFMPIPLPNANATVEEKRTEANVTWGRKLASHLTIQASLGGEYSQISQSGPAGLTRSFVRPKGFVSLAWKPEDTLDVRLRVERNVGQLNFFDFVASADIGSGNNNAGNPQLVPQQSWDLELEATKTLGRWGSVTLMSDYRFISDIVGQVPIGPNAEAPGNIDGTRVFGLRSTGTLKFDPVGWKGAQLEFGLRYRKARLDDPLTGERVPVSGNLKYEVDLNFRHDIPNSDWAYGGGYFGFGQEAQFRLNEIGQFTFDNGDASVFIEHKDVFGLKVRATVANLTGTGEDFRRIAYVNRRNGPVDFIEDRKRAFGQVIRFDISGKF